MATGPKPTRRTQDLVIGIDPSATGTGLVALSLADGTLVDHKRLTPKNTGVERLSSIGSWLTGWVGSLPGPVISSVMEGYSYGSQGTQAHKLGEVGGAIKLALRMSLDLPAAYPTIVTPTQVKKFCLGKGAGAKDLMLKGVLQRWGADFSTSDEADAYTLAQIGRHILLPLTTIKPQQEVLDALRKADAIHAEMPVAMRAHYPI